MDEGEVVRDDTVPLPSDAMMKKADDLIQFVANKTEEEFAEIDFT